MDDTKKLLDLIEKGTSPFHVVKAAAAQFEEAGFKKLELRENWQLEPATGYYMIHHGTSLVAFRTEAEPGAHPHFRIGAGHTDFPGLRIKPNPEITSGGYAQVNVEVYGGAILNTWLDRPLSIAGKVVLRSQDVFHPEVRLVDFARPVLTIPNLAIHLNKEVNKGVELNRQKDMLPVIGMLKEQLNEKQFFMQLLAEELEVAAEDILDYELGIYNLEPGCEVGMNKEFISAPRLDDLTAVQSLVSALTGSTGKDSIQVAALFDHEEIGSKTKQGGGSTLLSLVLEKILCSRGMGKEAYIESLQESLLFSVDVAHALHPNNREKSDLTSQAKLGSGFAIKIASSQAYATDSSIVGIVQQIAEREAIPYQKITNRSDVAGGSAMGSIASAMLPVKAADIGVPLLAMHSSRELIGAADQKYMTDLLQAFYSIAM